jgi:hypothetical protein
VKECEMKSTASYIAGSLGGLLLVMTGTANAQTAQPADSADAQVVRSQIHSQNQIRSRTAAGDQAQTQTRARTKTGAGEQTQTRTRAQAKAGAGDQVRKETQTKSQIKTKSRVRDGSGDQVQSMDKTRQGRPDANGKRGRDREQAVRQEDRTRSGNRSGNSRKRGGNRG